MVLHGDDDAQAPKVFFLEPDPSLVTCDFLEETFFHGYECYAVPKSPARDLKDVVRTLVMTFPELLLFFSIGGKEPLDSWAEYLWHLQNNHPFQLRIGVLHGPGSDERLREIKNLFLVDIGITAGTIPLQNSPKRDQTLLLNVLSANQAGGRRREIRMPSEAHFLVKFTVGGHQREEEVLDLSLSHFSVRFEGDDPGWEVGTQARKMRLSLAGLEVSVEAVTALRRYVGGKLLMVFLFEAENDRHQLFRSKVNQFIFRYFQDKTLGLLEKRMGLTFPSV